MCCKMIPLVGWRGWMRTAWTAGMVAAALATVHGQEPGALVGIVGPKAWWEAWLNPTTVFAGFAIYNWIFEMKHDVRDIKSRLLKLEEHRDSLPRLLDEDYVRRGVFEATIARDNRHGSGGRGGSRE